MNWLAVALGGALGAMGRYAITVYSFPLLANRFPVATLSVNLLGSFLIGVCYVLIIEKSAIAPEYRNWLMAGFLGAFTTFSTFALDAVTLWQNGHPQLAAMYVMASVAGCILAVAAGIHCTLRFF